MSDRHTASKVTVLSYSDFEKIKSTQQGGNIETRCKVKKALREGIHEMSLTHKNSTENWTLFAAKVQDALSYVPEKNSQKIKNT